MQMLARIAALRQELSSADPQQWKREIDRIQQDLVSPEGAANMATLLFAEPSALASLPDTPLSGKAARNAPSLSEDAPASDNLPNGQHEQGWSEIGEGRRIQQRKE